MIPSLRPYQETIVADARARLRRGCRRLLVVSPTGSGKTVMFAYITAKAAAKGKRVIIVAHRREIVSQISRALRAFDVEHGLIIPGRSFYPDLPIQVAMVQSLARRRLDRACDLLVIDEAHHSPAGYWDKVARRWPDAAHLGVTATPQRLDGRGLGRHFDQMILGPTVGELIDGSYLSDYDLIAPPVDTRELRKTHGEFTAASVEEFSERACIYGDAVAHYARHLAGRPTIAFCASVDRARKMAQDLRAQGWRAASVDGRMPVQSRTGVLEDLAEGRLSVVASCDLISEGFDAPAVAGVMLLRPTASLGLHLQQIGRALRPKPDGSRALILDHVGNCARLGLPTDDFAWSLDGRAVNKSPGITQCDACFRVWPAGKRPSVCEEGDIPGCPLLREPAAREGPETFDGDLVAMPSWRDGIDLSAGRLGPILDRAETEEHLRQIARARGYKRGWVQHILRERRTPT